MSLASPAPVGSRSPQWHAVRVRCWLLRDRPILSVALTLGVVVLAFGIYAVSQHLLGTALSIVALVIVMRRVWLPIHFRLDAQGIVRRVWSRSRRVPWTAIARYEACQRGVVLFPHGANYHLAAGQGLFIPWDNRRAEILALLNQFVVDSD